MLTSQQLADVDRHLRQDNWLLNDALVAELTDHYANAVAEKMGQGKTINDAVHEVDAGFGGRSGLSKLEKEYVRASNQTAWQAYRQILVKYVLPPRFLPFLVSGYGLYQLINENGLDAFLLLWFPVIALTVLVGLPFRKRNTREWRWDWNNRPLAGYYRRKYSGNERVANFVIGVAINLPIYAFMIYHPFTFKKSLDAEFPILATASIVLAVWLLATVAELTYRQNPLFRRLKRA